MTYHTGARMSEKVKEYQVEFETEAQHDKRFPHTAAIIDVTRCSVALADPADLMEAFQLLTSQESQDKLGYKIVRFKNKFEPKSTDTFKNIMVNALVRGGAGAALGVFGTPG